VKTPNHDIAPGLVASCQVCGSTRLELVIDLEHQALSDSLLARSQLDEPEVTYPSRFIRCVDCSLGQLDYVVEPETVFHPAYPYRTGITRELTTHQRSVASAAVTRYGLTPKSLVVDIGSNDGTLLSAFREQGLRVLGIEPTNIAKIANDNGIETLQSFFTETLAERIVETHGHAALVTATNVFAHVAGLGSIMRGIENLLGADGVFISESHYLADIIRDVQFDTMYHEHLRSYSLKSLLTLFGFYDFTVIDAERVDRYGGSLRVVAAKGRGRTVSAHIDVMLAAEAKLGLYDAAAYDDFARRTRKAKRDLVALAIDADAKGYRLVGNSCPARASTLLNYCGIDRDLMPYIAEQPTSLKLDKYLPGLHIPITENTVLFREQPDYVVLLAWHIWRPIAEDLRRRGLRSKFVVPLPDVSIADL
jgi:hypothetical protein